jgi:polysaccharide biosynthesis transport protein
MDDYQEEGQGLHLRDYWRIVQKRSWLIATVFVIVVVTTTVISLRTRPVYKATAQILIERENPQVVKVEQVMSVESAWMDYYPTQYKVLESRSLAKEVVRSLQLDKHPEFNAGPQRGFALFDVKSALASVVRAVVPRNEPKSKESPNSDEVDDPLSPFISAYLGRLSIEPIRNSRLVNVSLEANDPVLASRMANAHAQAYINKDLEMRLAASQDAVGWLSGRLEELKKALQVSEEALQKFQEKEDIVALESILSGGGGGKGETNIIAQKLAELNTGLTQARTGRIGLETLYRQLEDLSRKGGSVESIPQVIQSGLIQGLKANYTELTRQVSELREKYGEKHPRMIALHEEIRNIQGRISSEVGKIAKSVEIEYKVALAKEESLSQAMDTAKQEINELNKKAIQYGVLKREVESNRQIYDMVLKRTKETSLTSGLKATNIFIVDKAATPRAPVRPQTTRNVMLAVVIGLMLGLGLAFFFEYLDNTIHGPDEVKRYLGVPFLGPVGLAQMKGEGSGAHELLVMKDPRSNFAESLRNVRTNVVFSFTEPSQNGLVITSPCPLEGKTLISSNLAIIMAQMGRRVLLVDADMRKPRIHKVFGVSSAPGLSNLVLGKCSLAQAVRETPVKLLKVLPAGTIPPNPSELIGSKRMLELVGKLKEQFEFLIFDSPPILSVTDSAMLGGMLDGTVLVVKASQTARDHARRAVEHLSDVKARVLGVVLNQVDFEKERYNYSYYYRYYYYYTDEGERKQRRSRERRRSSEADGGEGSGKRLTGVTG